ncbi:hypothetical protein N7466_007245 [Penicillium verhagenii]|uniref:uncharacterized protein n=1 Tax=Penicillium verhagenii TaxID=1562060 RepID=UPI0025458023|nr:uncharacterized protein N7466_007245 [Penicillium verhagenii]KAJ5928289.1 hypothetical protein N7466_007245 [Penicillium verhagenii]
MSGKTWEDDVRRKLKDLGLKPFPDDPCIYSDHKLIIMIFVDDFLGIYHKQNAEHALGIKRGLNTGIIREWLQSQILEFASYTVFPRLARHAQTRFFP